MEDHIVRPPQHYQLDCRRLDGAVDVLVHTILRPHLRCTVQVAAISVEYVHACNLYYSTIVSWHSIWNTRASHGMCHRERAPVEWNSNKLQPDSVGPLWRGRLLLTWATWNILHCTTTYFLHDYWTSGDYVFFRCKPKLKHRQWTNTNLHTNKSLIELWLLFVIAIVLKICRMNLCFKQGSQKTQRLH